MTDYRDPPAKGDDPTLYDVLRTLIDHSTLGPRDKLKLHRNVDIVDPDAEAAPEEAVPETPEEELARLRQEVADYKAQTDAEKRVADAVPAGPFVPVPPVPPAA